MRNLENRTSGIIHTIDDSQHVEGACIDGARTSCGREVGEDTMEWTSSQATCRSCAKRGERPTEAPDTSQVVRTIVGPVVEGNGGTKYQETIRLHTPHRLGLRTVDILWVTDADKHNGSHPAGTVVTRVMHGHMGRGGVLHSETVRSA